MAYQRFHDEHVKSKRLAPTVKIQEPVKQPIVSLWWHVHSVCI